MASATTIENRLPDTIFCWKKREKQTTHESLLMRSNCESTYRNTIWIFSSDFVTFSSSLLEWALFFVLELHFHFFLFVLRLWKMKYFVLEFASTRCTLYRFCSLCLGFSLLRSRKVRFFSSSCNNCKLLWNYRVDVVISFDWLGCTKMCVLSVFFNILLLVRWSSTCIMLLCTANYLFNCSLMPPSCLLFFSLFCGLFVTQLLCALFFCEYAIVELFALNTVTAFKLKAMIAANERLRWTRSGQWNYLCVYVRTYKDKWAHHFLGA